jgi:hypothetical protein
MWCIPPKQSAEFVFHMEDVLEVYHRPYDPTRPVLCIDETLKQLIGETRPPLPLRPTMVERYDHEYVRNGRGPRQARLGGVGARPACSWPASHWPGGGTSPSPSIVVAAIGPLEAPPPTIRSLLDGRYAQAERVVLVPRAPHRPSGHLATQGRAVGDPAEHCLHQGRLAIHDRTGSRQAAIALPISSRLTVL